MASRQKSSHSAGIPCLRVVSLETTNLATTVASLAHTNVGDLVNWPRRSLAESGSVSFPVAFSALHFLADTTMMESAFVALGQISSIWLP